MTRLAEYWGLVPLSDLERAADELGRGDVTRARDEITRLIDQADEAAILLYTEPRRSVDQVEHAHKAPDQPSTARGGVGWGERIGYLGSILILVMALRSPAADGDATYADVGEASEGYTYNENSSRCLVDPPRAPRSIQAMWKIARAVSREERRQP